MKKNPNAATGWRQYRAKRNMLLLFATYAILPAVFAAKIYINIVEGDPAAFDGGSRILLAILCLGPALLLISWLAHDRYKGVSAIVLWLAGLHAVLATLFYSAAAFALWLAAVFAPLAALVSFGIYKTWQLMAPKRSGKPL